MSTCTNMMLRIRPTIILFGDSITQYGFSVGCEPGWVGLLSNAYQRRANVINMGFSGYNTRHAVDMLPSVFGADGADDEEGGEKGGKGEKGEKGPGALERIGRPLMVAVFFGANDAALPGEGAGGRQHVPIEEYENNLKVIVSRIRKQLEGVKNEDVSSNIAPILLITPPPVDKKAWDDYCIKEFNDLAPRTNLAAKQYGEKVKSVAKELGCSVVDSFALLGGHDTDGIYGKNLEDGLHLNGSGNKLLFEGFLNVVKNEYPDLAPMEDGEGKHGSSGIPLEGELWKDLC